MERGTRDLRRLSFVVLSLDNLSFFFWLGPLALYAPGGSLLSWGASFLSCVVGTTVHYMYNGSVILSAGPKVACTVFKSPGPSRAPQPINSSVLTRLVDAQGVALGESRSTLGCPSIYESVQVGWDKVHASTTWMRTHIPSLVRIRYVPLG